MDESEVPAAKGNLPEDFPQIEEVEAQLDDEAVTCGGEISDWLRLASSIKAEEQLKSIW